MEFGAVTFMLAEAILGKMGAKVTHHSVTRDFRDHAGGGDGKTEAITIDNSGLGNGKGNNRQAINQHVVRHAGEGGNGGAHRLMRRAQNIDPVDLNGIDDAYCPVEAGIGNQIVINFFAQVRRKLFGIV